MKYILLFLIFYGSYLSNSNASSVDSLVIKKSNSWSYKLYDPDKDEFLFELDNPEEYIVRDTFFVKKLLNHIEHLEQIGDCLPCAIEGKILCMNSDSLIGCISLNSKMVWHNGKTFMSNSFLTSFIDSICALSSKRTLKPQIARHPPKVPYAGGSAIFLSYLHDKIKNKGLDIEYEDSSYLFSVLLRIDKNGNAHNVYLRNYYNFKKQADLPQKLAVEIERILLDTCWEKNENIRVTDLVEFPVRLVFRRELEESRE